MFARNEMPTSTPQATLSSFATFESVFKFVKILDYNNQLTSVFRIEFKRHVFAELTKIIYSRWRKLPVHFTLACVTVRHVHFSQLKPFHTSMSSYLTIHIKLKKIQMSSFVIYWSHLLTSQAKVAAPHLSNLSSMRFSSRWERHSSPVPNLPLFDFLMQYSTARNAYSLLYAVRLKFNTNLLYRVFHDFRA